MNFVRIQSVGAYYTFHTNAVEKVCLHILMLIPDVRDRIRFSTPGFAEFSIFEVFLGGLFEGFFLGS